MLYETVIKQWLDRRDYTASIHFGHPLQFKSALNTLLPMPKSAEAEVNWKENSAVFICELEKN